MGLKLKTRLVLVFTIVFAINVLSSICCMRQKFGPVEPIPEKLEWEEIQPVEALPKTETSSNNEALPKTETSSPKPVKRRFVRMVYKLEYSHSVIRYTTCYTGYDKNDPGHGKYANQRFADKLHLYERRIRYDHNTVALCPEDKQYHLALINIPGKGWTHKYRVHIHGVHTDEISTHTDSKYFAVPRDRMKQSGRIDYLITQAGKFETKEQRVKNWKSINRKVDFWKWNVYRLYDDGLLEPVE